ncbi:MAG: glycoside hydrolase family 32 protein [bacterium]
MRLSKKIAVRNRYLNLPVKNGAPKVRMSFLAEGKKVREFEIELADGTPDFWVFSDVGAFEERTLTIEAEGEKIPAGALESIAQSDAIEGAESLYKEKHRPQFHFSSRRGWNNDPNGLVYYKGEYHLFYQHNPYGWRWGNMHWGHAVSTDLVHWEELPDALEPDERGTIFSGSGLVDWNNTAGFQTGDENVLVNVYTSAGGTSERSKGKPFVQSIAYSNDRGRTWTKYERNPVLGHIVGSNRDPKVIWHEPTRKWVMALYLDENDYALFSSPDLLRWERLCTITIPGASECPDIFELPVDGDPQNKSWVFWAANGSYLLGHFDGRTFVQEGDVHRCNWGGDSYAAQTWSDIPPEDGRRIQIAWLRVDLPGMPFNQQMTFPCELTLETTSEGIRLFSRPVKEIEKLHGKKHSRRNVNLAPGENPLSQISGELFDIRAEFEVGEATGFGFAIRGIPVAYDVRRGVLSCQAKTAPLFPVDGKIRLQILVDRTSIEIFGNDGRIAMPIGVIPEDGDRSLEVYTEGGITLVNSLEVYELRSIWGG